MGLQECLSLTEQASIVQQVTSRLQKDEFGGVANLARGVEEEGRPISSRKRWFPERTGDSCEAQVEGMKDYIEIIKEDRILVGATSHLFRPIFRFL